VIGDLGERIEPVLGQDHLAPGLREEDLGAPADGVRIVDHHHFHAGQAGGVAQGRVPFFRPHARQGGEQATCAEAGAHSKRVRKPEAIRDSWVRRII
jgi:hypothetical protein